jgi:guanine nucleotide-binding protein subunit alpha-12
MQVLVDAREKLEIPWENPTTYIAANQAILFRSNNELDVETFREYAPFIHRLWQDRAIKKAFDRRREFQLVSMMFM